MLCFLVRTCGHLFFTIKKKPQAPVLFKDKLPHLRVLERRRAGSFGDGWRFQSWWEISCQRQIAIKQGRFPRGAGKNTHTLVKWSGGEDTASPGCPVRSQNVCAPQTVCLAPLGRVPVWSGKTVPCLLLGKAYGGVTMTRPQQQEEALLSMAVSSARKECFPACAFEVAQPQQLLLSEGSTLLCESRHFRGLPFLGRRPPTW